jgi:hypothetical protein
LGSSDGIRSAAYSPPDPGWIGNSIEEYFSRRGFNQARNDFDGRAFARAIGADIAEDFAGL